MIRAFLNHDHLSKELNENYITLILEKENPTKVNDLDLLVYAMWPTNLSRNF